MVSVGIIGSQLSLSDVVHSVMAVVVVMGGHGHREQSFVIVVVKSIKLLVASTNLEMLAWQDPDCKKLGFPG